VKLGLKLLLAQVDVAVHGKGDSWGRFYQSVSAVIYG
jgi:hypothetical protein